MATQTAGRVIAVSQQGGSRWGPQGRLLPAAVEATPVLSGGALYVGATNGRLYVLDPATGLNLREPIFLGGSITSSPAVGADGTLYVATSSPVSAEGHLHAVTPAGTILWSFRTGGAIESSPAVAPDGTIYFGCFDRNFYALTPAGEKKWEFLTRAAIFSSPAIASDGTIYFGSRDQSLYALTPAGGLKWEKPTNDWIDASPALGADGTVYFASFDRNFYAVRADGSEKWRVNINSGSLSSAAVRADGAVIVGADDGLVRAFDSTNGALLPGRWPFDTQAEADDYIESSPTVAPDGSIYIGSLDGFLYKINGNGSPLSNVSSWPSFRRDVSRSGRKVIPAGGGQLVNISTRAQTGGDRPLIAGFIVQGATERAYLVRGIGPTLAMPPFDLINAIADPRLNINRLSELIRTNDNWGDLDNINRGVADTAERVGAFALPAGSRDAAVVEFLPPGVYTAQVEGVNGAAGVALVEVYDAIAGDGSSRILNLSTRGHVGTGEDILIAGLAVGGTGPVRLLVRGVGPALAQFGVTGVLAQPRLELLSRTGVSLGSNTGWTTGGNKGDIVGMATVVGAFALPDGSADSAMLFQAQPGLYTIQISGIGGTTGTALVEAYVLP